MTDIFGKIELLSMSDSEHHVTHVKNTVPTYFDKSTLNKNIKPLLVANLYAIS